MSKGKEKRNYCLYTLLATVFKSVSNFFYNIRYLFKHRLDRIYFIPNGVKLERLDDDNDWEVNRIIN